MRFPRRRTNQASRSPGSQAAGTPLDDRAAWSGPHDLGDRACCCPARPVVRVLIPPAPARPHSADLLLCGHHYRASGAALAAAGAVIMDDRRSDGTIVSTYEPGDHMPPTPRRGDELTALLTGSRFLTAGTVTISSFWVRR